jgi:hypothetical protein
MAQLLLRASLTAAKVGPAMPQEDVRYTHTHTHTHTRGRQLSRGAVGSDVSEMLLDDGMLY